MKVTPIKTPIVHAHDDLFEIIKNAVSEIPEKSVLVVTSKIVSLCEGRVEEIKNPGDRKYKQDLAKREADYYLDESHSQYDLVITIKDHIIAVNAGLDESNADGYYLLFPKDPFASAERIWNFVREEYGVKEVGILITDSRTIPMKWGSLGTALAYFGFKPVNNHIGETDLFDHEMVMTQVAVSEGLAAAAVLEMGEVDESTPLCLIEDAPMVKFIDRPLTQQEKDEITLNMEDDVYGPLLQAVPWKKNK